MKESPVTAPCVCVLGLAFMRHKLPFFVRLAWRGRPRVLVVLDRV